MSVINAVPLLAAAGGDYTISRSVRLRSSASAYFNRTFGAPTSGTTWTWSGWIKRGKVSSGYQRFFGHLYVSAPTNNQHYVGFNSDDTLEFEMYTTSAYNARLVTNQVFRDPSAWYHIVAVWNTSDATSSNRLKLYVNGQQITSFSTATYPSQNQTGFINQNGTGVGIGVDYPYNNSYFDGYLTEINFVDGQALTPTSFGQFNSVTGVWQPLKYTGTYGNNGFYLNFSDNSSNTATTIGKDYSGNGNNWTPNNISVTSGVTYDSMIDTPTSYIDGGTNRGNYAVMNPLQSGSYATQSNGNLTTTGNTATNSALVLASIGELTSGKWYWEYTQGTVASETCGVVTTYTPGTSLINGENIGAFGVGARANGQVYGGTVGSITSWTTGDVIGLALDCDNGAIYWSKNGTWLNSGVPTSGASKTGAVGTWTPSAAKVTPAFGAYNGGSVSATFGQRPFAYTLPSGFKALNTQNLPAPTISNGATVMAATTYTGTGATQTISNGNNTTANTTFQPDLVWTKARSSAIAGLMFDSVRGATKYLQTNSTSAEGTGADSLTAFASNGFTVGADTSTTGVNQNATTYVGWQWQAGQGTTSSNTNGSITSTVSVNATAGFSIVTYTGTGANATVGHGLGVAPNMVIVKERNAVRGWPVYHSSLTSATYYVDLQTTAAQASASTIWNSTAPTSTVFSIGTDTGTNQSTGTYVAYCFSAVAGYSAFGSYTGNGSGTDGPFVYLGFRPRWIMVKSSTEVNDWWLYDTSRDPYNAMNNLLRPDLSSAEVTQGWADYLSNGFKVRNTGQNNSGQTYIYAAFAENPFKLALAR